MDRINVTKTFMPPLEEYEEYLKGIWNRNMLTNQGILLKKFEKSMEDYLGTKHFHFVANGTLALQMALRVLDITNGEVITTPFSYVATTSAILWEHCKPVYVDIDPRTLCIDASKIEAAITKNTKAIMPVHIFGNPCEVEKIDALARKYQLKVIYDAAHAFGVEYNGQSLFNYGDISTASFHATKLIHTIEGGAIIAKDKTMDRKLELMKRFGHNGDKHIMLGINAKASEFQAAMGLCTLSHINEIIYGRKMVFDMYNLFLEDGYKHIEISKNTKYNYAYYPLILKNNNRVVKTIKALNSENIFPRRYFYPSLNTLPYLKNDQRCMISEDISSRVLCLPLYSGLEEKVVKRISKLVNTINVA